MASGSGDYSAFRNNSLPFPRPIHDQSFSTIVLSALAAGTCTTQLILCLIALLVFYRMPNLRSLLNLPVINPIASDFLRAIVGAFSIEIYSQQAQATAGTTRNAMCSAFHYANLVQIAWSNWALVIIAYSRYDSVNNHSSPKFTKTTLFRLAITSWLAALFTALPPLLGWSSFGLKKVDKIYSCKKSPQGKGLVHATYIPIFYLVNYLVPAVMVLLFLSRIFVIYRQYARSRESSNSSNTIIISSFQTERQPATVLSQIKETVRSKAFLYMVIIAMSNLILVAPYVFAQSYTSVRAELGLDEGISKTVFRLTALSFQLNFVVNAILYVFWIRTFRQAAIALCFRCHHNTRN
jgi:hypothetical protein